MRSNKKLWFTMSLLICALLCITALFSACDQAEPGDDEICNHKWGKWSVITESTCAKAGEEGRTCSLCQEKEKRALAVLDHQWGKWSVTKEATCQSAGEETRVCANDETHVETREVAKGGHAYVESVVSPLYLKSPANCVSPAVYYKSCICGDCHISEKTPTFTAGDKTTIHVYGEWESGDDAQHKHSCAYCDIVEFAPHTWNSGVETKAPTHTEDGVKTYTCTDCGKSYDEAIPADSDAHTYENSEWKKLSDEYHVRYCDGCGEPSEPVAHIFEVTETVDSTCVTPGTETKTCKDCGAVKTTTLPLEEHTYGEWEQHSASEHKKVCSVCEKSVITEAHVDWVQKEVESEATHTQEGVLIYACSVCGQTKKVKTEKLPEHDASLNWVKATDTQHKATCSCGEVFYDEHEWKTVGETPATHTKFGELRQECTVCDATQTKQLPKLKEHTYTYRFEPAGGSRHEAYCECGDVKLEYHTKWSDEETVKAPTCAVPGEKVKTCLDCGYESKIRIDATGAHTYDKVWHSDASNHWHECTECGVKSNVGAHTPNVTAPDRANPEQYCTVCEYVIAVYEHVCQADKTNGYLSNGSVHWYPCTDKECDRHVEETKHSGGVADCGSGKICEVCEKEYTEKDYSNHAIDTEKWVTDGGDTHWNPCDCNTKKHNEAYHKGGTATCTEKAKCEVCGASYGAVSAHTPDESKWLHDETVEPGTHWRECKECHAKIESTSALHDFADATCTEAKHCKVCGLTVGKELGHDYSQRGIDETNHWKYCVRCDEIDTTTVEAHKGGTASCTEKAVCSVCDTSYGELAKHEYQWQYDTEGNHFRKCGNCPDKTNEGTHEYPNGWVDNEDGTHSRTCACGYFESEIHQAPEWKPTADGKAHESVCVCGKVDTQEHDFTDWATSTEDDTKHTRKCKDCGYVETALHDYSQELEYLAPKCEESGYRITGCICGATHTEGLTAPGHQLDGGTVFNPTCTTEGYTLYSCTNKGCGYTERGEETIPTVDHSWIGVGTDAEWTLVPPTCEADGYKSRTCSVCDYVETVTEEGSKLGHNMVEDPAKSVAPSCSAAGSKHEYCANNCGKTTQVVVPKLDHSYVEIPATCDKAAYFECTNDGCDDSYEKEGSAALGHDWSIIVETVKVSCTENGYTLKKCSREGCTAGEKQFDVQTATGHKMTEATCGKASYCENGCGAVGNPATGEHKYALDTTDNRYVAASCTATGTDVYKCATCDASYTSESSKLPHDVSGAEWESYEEMDGTCVHVQMQKATCANCPAEVTKEVGRYETHSYVVTTENLATCQKEGTRFYDCKNCTEGDYRTVYSDPNAHKWVADGENRQKCSVEGCTETKTVVTTGGTEANLGAEDLGSEIQTQKGSVTLDKATQELLQNQLKDSENKNVTISVNTVGGEDRDKLTGSMSAADKEQLGNGEIYDLAMAAGGKDITDFAGGVVTVQLPYTLSEGEDPNNITVWYINDQGEVTAIKAVYAVINDTGYAVFETNHFSYYTVTRLTPEQRCKLYGCDYQSVDVPVTCISDGVKGEVCARCGKQNPKNYTVLKATGHKYELSKEYIKAPTCHEKGEGKMICQNDGCGTWYVVPVAELGHEWIEERQDATCSTEGYIKASCGRNCGVEEYYTVLAKIPHSYTESYTPATCTEAGYTTYTCSDCKASYITVDEKAPAMGHRKLKDHIVAPTCLAGGYTEHFCEDCGTKLANTDLTDAIGHEWNLEAATCSEDKLCKHCNLIDEHKTDKHDWDKDHGNCRHCRKDCEHKYYKVGKHNATCKDYGYYDIHCSVCQHDNKQIDKNDAPRNDHNWEYTGGYKAPTCKEDGYKEKFCPDCKTYENEKDPHGASYHKVVTRVIPATCGQEGYTLHYCKDCGEEIERTDKKDALQHSYFLIHTEPATCTKEGFDKVICVYCRDEKLNTIEKLDHTLGEDGKCTVCGYTETDSCLHDAEPEEEIFFLGGGVSCNNGVLIYKICPLCNEKVGGELVTSHIFETVEEIALKDYGCKCSDESLVIQRCTICGETSSNYIYPCKYQMSVSSYEKDGVKHNVENYSCVECKFQWSRDTASVMDGCAYTSETVWTLGLQTDQPYSVTAKGTQMRHKVNWVTDEERTKVEEFVKDGETLLRATQVSVGRCPTCGSMVGVEESIEVMTKDQIPLSMEESLYVALDAEGKELLLYQRYYGEATYTTVDGELCIDTLTEREYVFDGLGNVVYIEEEFSRMDPKLERAVYEYEALYSVVDGEEVLLEKAEAEMALVTLPDGSQSWKESTVREATYDVDGTLVKYYEIKFEYIIDENDPCMLTVKATDSNGEGWSSIENYHGKTRFEYQYYNGISCDGGVKVTEFCVNCGKQLGEYDSWGHEYNEKDESSIVVDLGQYGCVCGGEVRTQTCVRCGETSTNVFIKCPLMGYGNDSPDGKSYFTNTCQNPECGFTYTTESWNSTGDDCVNYYHTKYTFGIKSDVEPYEVTISKVNGYSHSYQETALDPVVSEGEFNGIPVQVITAETVRKCTKCGEIVDKTVKTVKLDANGNRLYEETQKYTSNEKGGELYLSSVQRDEYATATLKNGKTVCYQTLSRQENRNTEGNIYWYREWVYTYAEGNYCNSVVTYTDSKGESQTGEVLKHVEIVSEVNFLTETHSCQFGVSVVSVCLGCGETVVNETVYDHNMTGESIDLREYGSVCGADVSIGSCEYCDYVTLYGISHNCEFESTKESIKTETGRRTIETHTCVKCGFVYTSESWSETVNCTRTQYKKLAFGIQNGATGLEIVTKNTSGSSHANRYEELANYSEQKTIDGVTYNVHVSEYRHVCGNCGTVSNHRRTERMQDENGNTLKMIETVFEVNANGESYAAREVVTDYVIFEKPNGDTVVKIAKEATTEYDSEKNVTFTSQSVYTYADGSFCTYTVTYTDSNGKADTFEKSSHDNQIAQGELIEGATTCLDGVLLRWICRDCGKELSTDTVYEHMTFTKELDFSEYGMTCGTRFHINSCACGENKSLWTSADGKGCAFSGEGHEEIDSNNISHNICVFTCQNCGFIYSEDSWNEYSETCERIEHVTYRFGLDKEGGNWIASESIDVNCGISHSGTPVYGNETESSETESSETEGDVTLKVITVTVEYVCDRCKAIERKEIVIRKYDADGNLIFQSTERLMPDSGAEDGFRKDNVFTQKWIVYTKADGTQATVIAEELTEHFDASGVCYGFDRYAYTYKDGNYCIANVIYSTADGEQWADQRGEHSSIYTSYILREGSVTCLDGLYSVQICRACGTEVSRGEYHKANHVINRNGTPAERFDLTEYGNACGGYVEVFTCPCGAWKDITVSAECDFTHDEDEWYSFTDENEKFHSFAVYGCPEVNCGFKYVLMNWTTSENCMGIRHRKILLGFDPATQTWTDEISYDYETGSTYHNMEYFYESTTDENKNQIEHYGEACNTCGAKSYETVVTNYVDENGILISEYENKHYHTSTASNPVRSSVYELRHVVQTVKGYTRYVTMYRENREYDVNGTETYWNKETYTYDQDSLCTGMVLYQNIENPEGYEQPFVNHEHSIQEWIVEPTCTQNGIVKWICSSCDDYSENESSEFGHDYQYHPKKKLYVCRRCGLENFTGNDGFVLLEDLTLELGNAAEYVVGYRNGWGDQYSFMVSIVFADGTEEFLELGVNDDGKSIIRINAAEVTDAAKKLGLNACEYMIRLRFIPLETDGEYDFAITLDPHLYALDKDACVTPDDPCNEKWVKAYACVNCGDTYTEEGYEGHHYAYSSYQVGDCDPTFRFNFNTCTVCGTVTQDGMSSNGGDYCSFSQEQIDSYQDAYGMYCETNRFTCSKCGYVYQTKSYYEKTDDPCVYIHYTVYSFGLSEDGETFAYERTASRRSNNHASQKVEIEPEVTVDADGNTVTVTGYDYVCTVCGYVDNTYRKTMITDADGNPVKKIEEYTYQLCESDYNEYTYFKGEDGGYYVSEYYHEHQNQSGDSYDIWITTYTYDFTNNTRTYERIRMYGGVEMGTESFRPTGGGSDSEGGDDTTEGGENKPEGGDDTTEGGENKPEDGEDTTEGEGSGSDGKDDPIEGGDETTGDDTGTEVDPPIEGGDSGNTGDAYPDEIRILITNLLTTNRGMFVDTVESGDVISMAAYERNAMLEEKLNCVLNFETCTAGSEFIAYAQNSYLAGTPVDIVAGTAMDHAKLAASDVYQDLNGEDFSAMRMNEAWWNASYNQAATVNGKQYTALGSANITAYDMSSVIFVNMLLADQLQFDPFESVLNGEWTVEMLYEYSTMLYEDMNNDGAANAGDLFGLTSATTTKAAHGFLRGFDLSLLTYNEELGLYRVTSDTDQLNEAFEMVNKLWSNMGSYAYTTAADAYTAFSENKSLFLADNLYRASSVRSALLAESFTYGILPMPKLDAEQEGYHTAVGATHNAFAVSKTVDAKRAAEVLEAMNAISYETVMPYYRDSVMDIEHTEDERAVAVVKLHLESLTWEFEDVYASTIDSPVNLLWVNPLRSGNMLNMVLDQYREYINEQVAMLFEALNQAS